MTAFSANLNKIALLRNTRDNGLPSVERAGLICLQAGAAGLTLHPRPDRRHALPSDVHLLRGLTRQANAELNVEGYPDSELLNLVEAAKADQCTLVPDAPGQRTSDHGWTVTQHADHLQTVCARLRKAGVRVSIFIDPDPAQATAAAAVGAQRIELYTEPYAQAHARGAAATELARYAATAKAAQAAGLAVNAGHDLSLLNLADLLRAVPGIAEVSIGHALIADAIDLGLSEAVRRYVAICRAASDSNGDRLP